jgi:hypothetical protein
MSTKSVGKAKGGVSHFHFSALLAAVLAISAMGPSSASAQTAQSPQICTSTITVTGTHTLMGNVNPCPSVSPAIYVTSGSTLNLNGWRIYGTKASGSIGAEVEEGANVLGGPRITPANGPGTITGFDTGIQLDYDNNTVTHVHVTYNNTGILSEIGGNNIVANTLKGNSCLGIGSYPSQVNPDSIVNNLIAGSNAPVSTACPAGGVGIDIGYGNGTYGVGVSGNAVHNNGTGMRADLSGLSIVVSGNVFSNNLLSGASIKNANEFQGLDASGNWFDSNGQDGLSLTNMVNGSLIQNNFAYGNRVYGISLFSSYNPYTQNSFTGNVALGNVKDDLYWDVYSIGNTWTGNTCDTRSTAVPPQLPPC